MAFDDVRAKQQLVDDQNKRVTDLETKKQRVILMMQSELDAIQSKYANDNRKVKQDIQTLQNNLKALQEDIDYYQKEQTKLQNQLNKLQEEQSGLQRKHNEQYNRFNDLNKKLSGITKDQTEAERRARDTRMREINALESEIRQKRSSLGNLQADLTRAMTNQAKANQANSNFAPSTAGRTNLNIKSSGGYSSRSSDSRRAA